jgi:hypothetical protein
MHIPRTVWILTATIVLALASAGWASYAPCPAARYDVAGAALVTGVPGTKPDQIAIETAGALEASAPTALVSSGCPQTRARWKGTRTGTRLSVRFPACAGLPGPVRLRAKVDPSCATMTGVFAGRSFPRRPFTATLAGLHTGRVLGTVSASHGDRPVLLPGATVFLRDHLTMARDPGDATTDVRGDFSLAHQGSGVYDVCAEAVGFVTVCDGESVDFTSPTPGETFSRNLVLRPAGGAVHGRVLLADGTPCFHEQSSFGVQVAATVTLGSMTVTGNYLGEYLLAGVPDVGAYPFDVSCETLHENVTVSIGATHLSGAQPVDFPLRNRPPVIEILAASDATGWLRSASPGETVQVTADASDPDGDPLHYRWRDGNDLLTPVDAANIAWPLLGVEAANTITLEVADGKGGFAERQLVLGTSQTGDRFIGTVLDGATGAAIADAHVDVDGISTTSDAVGWFRIATPPGERHVLTARRAGYALVSQIHHGPAAGLKIRMKPAQRTTVDPTQDIDLSTGRKGTTVYIAANSLVDGNGKPPSGPVTIDHSTYDPMLGDAVPGDREVLDASHQPLTAHHVQAMSLDITDASGRRFNLAAGHPALVTFQAPAQASPPETLTLAHYDEATGTWQETGHAVRRGARYLAVVPNFSSWDLTQDGDDTACLRVDVDDNQLERPFHVRVIIKPNAQTWEKIGEFSVTDQTTLITGLQPNTVGFLELSPQDDDHRIVQLVQFGTNAGGVFGQPAFPYSKCTQVTLKASLPTSTWLDRFNFGSDQDGEDYYASIGARPDKDTFKKWKDANGFVTGDSVSDVAFFNPNEIGLGRRANCKMTPLPGPIYVACYVTKFGHVGGSPDEMLDDTIDHQNPGDTVALEFSPGPYTNGKRITKFYVYGPDGDLKTHTAFDPQGDVKHVPNVCLHCHGAQVDNANHGGDVHGRFVTLDPHAYRYPPSGPYALANQQERLRELNSMIAYALRHEGPGWDLMDSIYPQGVHNSGSTAIPAPVPPQWAGSEQLYTDIVKPSCRTCHMYQGYVGDTPSVGHRFDFFEPDPGWLTQGYWDVCKGTMPNAISPMLRLWRTNDPSLIDEFGNYFGLPGCGSTDEPPTVHIDTPTDGDTVAFGGLGITHFGATVNDPDDGPNTLSVTWTSDEGVMGYGPQIDYVFATPSAHPVTVTVVDPHGYKTSATITVHGDNTPPTVTIVKPTAGQVLYRNVAYPFLATAFDPNEPYLTLDCSSLIWSSSNPNDPIEVGCQPTFTFTTVGQRTIQVFGLDSDGGNGTVMQVVNVVDPPKNSPPIVVINNPGQGDSLDRDVPVVLAGSATDPDGLVTPTVSWTMQVGGGPETTIGNTLSVGWIPQNYLPQSCSDVAVTLRLYATDPDGTRTDAVTVSVLYPPC